MSTLFCFKTSSRTDLYIFASTPLQKTFPSYLLDLIFDPIISVLFHIYFCIFIYFVIFHGLNHHFPGILFLLCVLNLSINYLRTYLLKVTSYPHTFEVQVIYVLISLFYLVYFYNHLE